MHLRQRSYPFRWLPTLLIIVATLLTTSPSKAARILSEDGIGDSKPKAREDALNTLASRIFVRLENEVKLYENSKGENYFHSSTHSSTDLPMMGVEFRYRTQGGQIQCTASLDLDKAVPLYRQQLQQLQQNVNQQYASLAKLPVNAHYDHLSRLLGQYEQFEKYLTVLTYIEGKASGEFQPTASKADIQRQLLLLEKRVTSLALAAQLLTKEVSQSEIYVRPATLEGSHAVTPFAKALLDQINARLTTAKKPSEARFLMNGHYRIHPNSVLLSYSLADSQGKTLFKRVLELDPVSYQGYEIEPRDLDFDRLLHNGYVVSSDLEVELATQKGRLDLAFDTDDEVQVLVKLNQPGYLYIVGHTNNDHERLSYLLDIGPQDGSNPNQWQPQRFIRYIGPDQVNKWVSLARPFEVCPPYGEESLQLIASNKNLASALPKARWHAGLRYYIVDRDSNKVVMETRGLKPKATGSSKAEVQSAEAVMMFSTFEAASKLLQEEDRCLGR